MITEAAQRTQTALVQGVCDGFNRIKGQSIDRLTTKVMVGYLSAGSIALQCIGADNAADKFLGAARAIDEDWMSFEQTLRSLAAQFSSTSTTGEILISGVTESGKSTSFGQYLHRA